MIWLGLKIPVVSTLAVYFSPDTLLIYIYNVICIIASSLILTFVHINNIVFDCHIVRSIAVAGSPRPIRIRTKKCRR
jgi:hypothetical protein